MPKRAQRKALIYDRVSVLRNGNRAEPITQSKSVDTRIAESTAWANQEGWEIVGTYRDDGISASRYARGKERPAWQQVMEHITNGEVDILVTTEVSRATRDRPVWAALMAACQERGVLFGINGTMHDPNEPDDAFMLDLQASLGVRESAMTSKRIKRLVAARAADGHVHGKVPFGYKRVYDQHSGKLVRQVPDDDPAGRDPSDPPRAPLVREMLTRFLSGESAYAIAQDFNRRGIKGPTGGKWINTRIRRILLSPATAGLREHRGEIIGPAQWEGIISEAERAQVLAITSDPSRYREKRKGIQHLLVGIAQCGKPGCDGTMTWVSNRGTPSYVCKQGFCIAAKEAWVDDLVERFIVAYLSTPGVLDDIAADGDEEVEAALERIQVLRGKIADARVKTQSGDLSLESFAAFEKAWLAEIETLRRKTTPKHVSPLVPELVGPNAAKGWRRLLLEQKREILRSLVTVTIHPVESRKSFHQLDPARVQVAPLRPTRE